ncbi:MAG: ABC transporter permease, partial [Ilumatobacteraceae bacterium]
MSATVMLSAEQRKQSRNTGITLIILGVISAVFFTRDGGPAGFGLTESFTLDLPSQRFAQVLAVALVGAGAFQLYRGFGRLMNVFLATGTALFVISFLAWSASGESCNFTGMLQDTVARSVPITLGAVAGILCERSGVINIAIEGQLLFAAFTGSIVGSVLNPWLGIVGAVASGVALGGLLGVLAIKFQVDQVIVGFAINFLSLGVTSFVGQRVLVTNQDYNYLTPFRPIDIPLLSDIPVIGPSMFEQNLFVYFSYAVVAATTWWMFRTRWGLRTRAIGEYPKAAGSLGVDVLKLR